jgi:leader peptidase (prepilin peptidase)/N-methyltransferase
LSDLAGSILNNVWLFHSSLLIVGLVVGSFLNVVILRLPPRMEWEWRNQCRALLAGGDESGESADDPQPPGLVLDHSRCPHCGRHLRPWENLPLIGWLWLRGRCAGCSGAISIQYPLVELATAILTLLVGWWYGPTWTTLALLAFSWCLIAASVIDLRTLFLPDDLLLPLLWLGLAVSLTGHGLVSPSGAIVGAIAGYLSLWSVFHLFRLITGKEGMGYGDFKLLAVIGAWGGWAVLPQVILLSSLLGAVVGLTLVVVGGHDRQRPIPFGPWLAGAGWIALMWGDSISDAYWQLML